MSQDEHEENCGGRYASPSKWSVKRADAGRPVSKDTIANDRLSSGRLLIWDLMIAAGTGMPSFAPDPDSQDVSAQLFETRAQHFKPQNHLGTPQEPQQPGTPGTPEVPAPQPTTFDLAPIIELLRTLAEVRGIWDAIGKATREIQKAGGHRAGEAEPVR